MAGGATTREQVRGEVSPSGPGPDVDEPLHRAFLWTIAGLVILVLWVRPMFSSLWTDEIGTWWVANGDLGHVIRRSQAVQGQSPLYYFIAWATRHVSGRSEFGFRLPSLIFAGIAAYLVFRIATRLVDVETGRIAAVAFVTWPTIAFAASDARPYALATLLAVASTWALIVWLDSARLSAGLCYVVLASAVPYAHPLFGMVLIPQLAYALIRSREGSTAVRLRGLVFAAGGIVLLVVPVGIELMMLWGRHEDWSIPNPVTVPWVTQMLLPPALLAAVAVGGLITSRTFRFRWLTGVPPRSALLLLLGLGLVPAAILVGFSLASPVQLVEPRYFISRPQACYCFSRCVSDASSPHRPAAQSLPFSCPSILELASPYKSGDFRGAATLVRGTATQDTTVFIASGFQESLQRDWYTDPERQGLLTAETSFYPVPGHVVPLPVKLDASTQALVAEQLSSGLATAQSVVTVTPTDAAYVVWLDQYMRDRGLDEPSHR